MIDPSFAVQGAVGVVAVALVGIFVKHWRDMIVKIIPEGFKILRDEMRIAERGAAARHKEHIAHMQRIEDSLARQDGERQQRIAARVKRRRKEPKTRSQTPKKPR